MPLLYRAADLVITAVFTILGTGALFYLPDARGAGLLRRWSPEARRMLFRILGCVFCTWGWARVFGEVAALF